MTPPESSPDLLTLEPLLEAVRAGVEDAGWQLSGLQKTTSHEFEGRWAGESTRSAYLFFHREDLPESVSMEVFLDETTGGLRGNLALVLEGPRLGRLGAVSDVLERVAAASLETLPDGHPTPVSVRVAIPDGDTPPEYAHVQFRIKVTILSEAVCVGVSVVSALSSSVVTSFEALLERPEVAEMLPPVID